MLSEISKYDLYYYLTRDNKNNLSRPYLEIYEPHQLIRLGYSFHASSKSFFFIKLLEKYDDDNKKNDLLNVEKEKTIDNDNIKHNMELIKREQK
jgi:hypothetical protein